MRLHEGRDMYRVLIVEDEKAAADLLQGLLASYGASRSLELETRVMPAAMEMLGFRERYDICLLDIDLPGISGMEAAQMLRMHDQVASVIFVTNLAKFAVRGYEVNACGFIVKPATASSLAMAMDRAIRRLGPASVGPLQVSTGDGLRMVAPPDLAFAEAHDHNVIYHLADGEKLVSPGKLSQVERDLEGSTFLRVGRSFLVNMRRISSVRGNEIVMVTGERLPIPRGRKRDVTDAIADFLGGSR